MTTMETEAVFAGETRVLDGCEIRAVETGSGRRQFEGIIAPWDRWALIGGMFEERYQRNCFARAVQDGKSFPLLVGHDMSSLPIGRTSKLLDTDIGLRGVFDLSDTDRARETWELIHDGSLQALSPGFRALRGQDLYEPADPPKFPRITRRNAQLVEVSVVPAGAYSEATISVHTRSLEVVVGRSTTPYRDRYSEKLESLRYSPVERLNRPAS